MNRSSETLTAPLNTFGEWGHRLYQGIKSRAEFGQARRGVERQVDKLLTELKEAKPDSYYQATLYPKKGQNQIVPLTGTKIIEVKIEAAKGLGFGQSFPASDKEKVGMTLVYINDGFPSYDGSKNTLIFEPNVYGFLNYLGTIDNSGYPLGFKTEAVTLKQAHSVLKSLLPEAKDGSRLLV